MKYRLVVLLLILSSSIMAMDQNTPSLLTESEQQEANTALKRLTPEKSDDDIPDILDYLRTDVYKDGQKQYDGPVRLFVALTIAQDPTYSKWQSTIIQTIEQTESLHLLPRLKSNDGHKSIELQQNALISFSKKMTISDPATAICLIALNDKLKSRLAFREKALNIFSVARSLNALEATVENSINFKDMLMLQSPDSDSRLFHECCKKIINNMGYLRESCENQQKRINPLLRSILKSWAEKSKIDINTPDLSYENTPLHYVIKYQTNSKDLNPVVKALLSAKADPTIKNINGETPLDLCQKKSTKKLLKKWIAKYESTPDSQEQGQTATTTTTTTTDE